MDEYKEDRIIKNIVINLPSKEAIFTDKTKLVLPKRLYADGKRPSKMRQKLGEYANMKGCYVHYWEKDNGDKTIIYVGQTTKSFLARLDFEFTMSRNPVSKKFKQEMTKHIKDGNTIYTVLIPSNSDKMNKIISADFVSEKHRILILEQALIAAFASEDLLNSTSC